MVRCHQAQSQPEEEDEAEEDEAEELGHAETYADYVPSKCECGAAPPPRGAPAGAPRPVWPSPTALGAELSSHTPFPRSPRRC